MRCRAPEDKSDLIQIGRYPSQIIGTLLGYQSRTLQICVRQGRKDAAELPPPAGVGPAATVFWPRWSERMADYENDRIVATTTQARAGITGHNVRYVLGFSTAGLIALFVTIYLYYFA